MAANPLYNGQDFPKYIFTNKIKSYLFVDFDIIFMNEDFWQIVKSYVESVNIHKIVVESLKPEYHFIEEVDVAVLPEAFMKLVLTENLEGYFSCSANLHMITNQTLIYPIGNEEVFCILADRDYSIGVIGFSNPKKPEIFSDYEIRDIADYLKVNFAGRDLSDSLRNELSVNWNFLPSE